MEDERAGFIDGTKLDCRGVLSVLEERVKEMASGDEIEALVPDLLGRHEILQWADRKGHRIIKELRVEGAYRLTIAK